MLKNLFVARLRDYDCLNVFFSYSCAWKGPIPNDPAVTLMNRQLSNAGKIVALVLATILLNGCATGLKGRPDRPIPVADEMKLATNAANLFAAQYFAALGYDQKIVDLYSTDITTIAGDPKPDLAVMSRDDFVYAKLRLHELAFQEYAQALSVEGRGGALAATVATLGLSAASSVISVEATKSLLSAAVTAIAGSQEAYGKDVLLERTIEALFAQMVANQLEIRVQIETNLMEDHLAYPLEEAALDVEKYAMASNVNIALSALAKEAGDKVEQATEELEEIRTGEYLKDSSGDLLRAFWKPDGATKNASNEAKIKNWMVENIGAKVVGTQIRPSLTYFIRAKEYRSKREDAVRALDLN